MLKFNDVPRRIDEIPEEVSTIAFLLIEISRRLLYRKLSGQLTFRGYPNCHGVVHAYAAALRGLEVVHGATIYITDQPRTTSHSWLRFRDHPKFGIDVAPFGAIPLLSVPTLIFFDEYVVFREVPLPEGVTMYHEEEIAGLREEIKVICKEITQEETPAA